MPRQTDLFDLFAGILSPVAYRKLRSGWHHLFRLAIWKRFPAGKLADHFHPVIGRPPWCWAHLKRDFQALIDLRTTRSNGSDAT